MPCPECGKRTDVYDSRLNTRLLVRRRRSCSHCGFRFATIEIMNEYHPLGKKEKPNAPVPSAPKPPVKEKAKKERPVRQPSSGPGRKVNVSVSSREDKPAWSSYLDQEDFEDLASYIDLPKGMGDD